jgi:heme exporter protein B
VELLGLEVLLAAGVAILYNADLRGWVVLVVSCLEASIGLAAAGCLYGVLSAGTRVRETLLPLLLVPVAAPVVLAATRAWEGALAGTPSDSWPWVRLLGVFAVIYAAVGTVGFGLLLEEA